jgi:hypothetical protein
MNFYNAYLQGVNQTIGDHSRFARQFQSNQEAASNNNGVTSSPPPVNPLTNDPGQLFNFMMMLFQMMGAMQVPAQHPAPPIAPPYVPGLNTTGSPPYQNPAISSLESKLTLKSAIASAENENIVFSPADIEAVRTDLQTGKFTPADLGEALMYELDQAPDKYLGAVGQLIHHLTDSGDLNIASFMQNEYLLKLKPQRQEALMSIIQEGGLLLNDSQPNRRLIAFILDNLDKPGDAQSKPFIHQLLQNLHKNHASQPESPQGKVLNQLVILAGISVDEAGKLIF